MVHRDVEPGPINFHNLQSQPGYPSFMIAKQTHTIGVSAFPAEESYRQRYDDNAQHERSDGNPHGLSIKGKKGLTGLAGLAFGPAYLMFDVDILSM
jgi:hypothetical protein